MYCQLLFLKYCEYPRFPIHLIPDFLVWVTKRSSKSTPRCSLRFVKPEYIVRLAKGHLTIRGRVVTDLNFFNHREVEI